MKSEREKMLAGEPYVAADPKLAALNLRAQTLLHAFNASPPAAFEERRALVRQLFGAGSVVTRDIPPYTLAVGNPCRVIRELPRP